MSGYRYGVLGAGRQGAAAAYDLIVHGKADSVVLADIDVARAEAAARRVNALTKTDRASATRLDVLDRAALLDVLRPLDAAIVAISYRLTYAIAEAAIEARTSYCDLGGDTQTALRIIGLADRARDAGVALVPDCGEAPGLASNLEAYAMSLLDEPEDVLLLDGGLPLHPTPPWNYQCTFNIDGLTNEYAGGADWVRDGKIVHVETFDPTEYELVDLGDPVGTLEAFSAGGGSTTPWTLGRRLRSLRNKVIRYPGHVVQWKAFQDAGLFSDEPVDVRGTRVAPRDLFHALIDPQIRAPEEIEDIVIAHVIAKGRTDGRPHTAVVDMRVVRDDVLGYTAMEQTTGWHAAIMCHLLAAGTVSRGAFPVEEAVEPAVMVSELRARGFPITESVEPTA